MHAPEPVSLDRVIDELWGERPPATAQHAVQVYVSAIRKLLRAAGGRGGGGGTEFCVGVCDRGRSIPRLHACAQAPSRACMYFPRTIPERPDRERERGLSRRVGLRLVGLKARGLSLATARRPQPPRLGGAVWPRLERTNYPSDLLGHEMPRFVRCRIPVFDPGLIAAVSMRSSAPKGAEHTRSGP